MIAKRLDTFWKLNEKVLLFNIIIKNTLVFEGTGYHVDQSHFDWTKERFLVLE